jgi:hypothetical protein
VHGREIFPKIVKGTKGASLECLECGHSGAYRITVYDGKIFLSFVTVYLG